VGTGEEWVDCKETLHRLYIYLDGELTDERRAEIKRHLDECPPCYEAFDFEADLRIVIAQRCKDRVPDTLRERVQRALVDEERQQP
jgi:mycothiol system anti-sigma-R factor